MGALTTKPFKCDVIVIARDHEHSVGGVLAKLPRRAIRNAIVIDNGSRDATGRVAEAAGAVVLREPERGYGAACRRAVSYLMSLPVPPDVAVFLDGDAADDAAQVLLLLEPMRSGHFDLVIGSRTAPRKRAGNLVAVGLIRAIYGHRYTDLSSFRAIRYPALVALGMRDGDDGWLVEMQVKALTAGLRVAEVPVRAPAPAAGKVKFLSRMRAGVVTGSKILFTILRHSTAR